jgi:hypothetical protein
MFNATKNDKTILPTNTLHNICVAKFFNKAIIHIHIHFY